MFFYSETLTSEQVENIITAWREQHVFSGSLAVDSSDRFGYSVDINDAGDRVVIGAYLDERIGGSSSEGLAYLFVSGTTGWVQQHIFSGSLAIDVSDFFGTSVAINSAGDRVVVSAFGDETISGSYNNEGLAYLFTSGTGGWTEQHVFSGSLAADRNDFFGSSVAINNIGDIVAVGAKWDERVGGSSSEGLVYLFVSGSGGWSEQQIFSGSLATGSNEQFGASVAINSVGDRVVIGAPGDERVDGSSGEGLVYLFVSGTTGWIQQHIFSGSLAIDVSDFFGYSVSINSTGDRIIAGAFSDEKIGSLNASGLAYLFVSGTGGWEEQHIFSGSLAVDSSDYFGYSVDINDAGDRVVVGAYNDEKMGNLNASGLAYLFVSGTTGWIQQHIFSGSLAVDTSDSFGYSVAINSTGDRVLAGTIGDERIGGSSNEGLAYIFSEE